MIADAALQFSDAQAVTSSVASDNYMDAGLARDLGNGAELTIVVTLVQAMVGNGVTVDVQLQGSSSNSFGSPVTEDCGTFPANSPIGTRILHKLSPQFAANNEFLQLYYNVSGGSLSAGAFTAQLLKDADDVTVYKRGYTIS